jgi:hypothetical protein
MIILTFMCRYHKVQRSALFEHANARFSVRVVAVKWWGGLIAVKTDELDCGKALQALGEIHTPQGRNQRRRHE